MKERKNEIKKKTCNENREGLKEINPEKKENNEKMKHSRKNKRKK